jgi:hypothetical protein
LKQAAVMGIFLGYSLQNMDRLDVRREKDEKEDGFIFDDANGNVNNSRKNAS